MIQIIECEQNSPEWFEARKGLVTASEFKTIIGIKKDAKDKKTRQTYMRKLAGELITGEPMPAGFQSAAMERGKIMEDEARDYYSLVKSVEPRRVGVVRDGIFMCGASPDSLIDEDGGLEIKTAEPHIQLERLESGELPPEHLFQVHGNIWVAKRKWWDFMSYWPKMPPLIVRVMRDEAICKQIEDAVVEFNKELYTIVNKYGGQSAKVAA